MAQPIDAPIVCPILVGRDVHLAALRERLDAAVAGHGQTVLITGEAGIGKSRLVAEAAAFARDREMRVLVGQCFEPDRALPFAPWRDLVRSHLLGQPWAAAALADAAPDLAALVPDLARPELGLGSAVTTLPGAEPDQRRIVDAVLRLVTTLSAQSPLLLIVEDVHWSDEASLELLLPLARRIQGQSGLSATLIVTFRNDEGSPALASTLAALDRERLAAEARLGQLPRAEVVAMLRAMSDGHTPIAAATAETIYRLSEGNPFFVEELFRATLAMDESNPLHRDVGAAAETSPPIPLPRTVAEVVKRRVRYLSAGARETLTVAAVSGRRFDFTLLQTLSGCDEAELVARIKELVAAKLVVEESADRFAFRHALLRRAVEDQLLARERRALHQQILQMLLRVDPGIRAHPAADLARHAAAAGAWSEALEFGQRAGAQALALYAPSAAVELLSLASDAAMHLERPPSSSLLRSRGQAHELLGTFEAARADYETAVTLAQESGNRQDECEALLALGGLWAGRDYELSGPYIRQALGIARVLGDPALQARVLNRLANWHANQEEPMAALALHEQALALVEHLDDRRGIAETLDLIGMARYLAGDCLGSAAAYRRAIPVLRDLNDRRTLVNALAGLGFAMSTLDTPIGIEAPGSHEERLAFVEEAVSLAREIDGRAEEAMARCCAALIVGERSLTDGIDHANIALQIADEIGHRQWATLAHFILGSLHRMLLDADAARQHFDTALTNARATGAPFWVREVLAHLAELLVFAGDLERAVETIAQAVDDTTPMQTFDQREAWFASARVALAQGQSRRALEIGDRLIHVATPDPERDLVCLSHLALLRGEALTALGSTEEAGAALAAAWDGARRQENLPLLWPVHLARATHLRALGRREDAANEIAAAHAVVQQIASGMSDSTSREAFLRRAAAHLPPRALSPRRAAKAAYDGLTAREREVAALVAAGHSNREIGASLFLTERTAATHVGNILGKLGLKTRAQAAIWAQERDLTEARDP